MGHRQIGEAVVILREDAPEEFKLVAYMSCIDASRNVASDLRSELHQLVRSKLPAYMVPSAYIFLDSLPHAFDDKVDRDALPRPSDPN
jgi:acyl-coenzyme A synthetase/AMP-(fatty) acid ligase